MAAVEQGAAPAARQRFIPDLLVTHAEELAYLSARRRATVASPALTARHLAEVNERIEAHAQGLLVAGAALVESAAPWLASAERGESFAGAYALLRGPDPAWAGRVLDAFEAAQGDGLAGLRDAMCLAGGETLVPRLAAVFISGDVAHAAAAGAVLASMRKLDPAAPRLAELLADPEPAVSMLGWRIATRVDEVGAAIARPAADALLSEDQGVVAAALGWAVWHAEPWAFKATLKLAEQGSEAGLQWLAAIGAPQDLPALRRALDEAAPGPHRLDLAGRFGHPELIEWLIEKMDPADPALASAAGEAWARITGIDIHGERRTLPVRDDADDFECDFAEDVWLPDVGKARRMLERHGPGWRAGQRWCRGCDVSTSLRREAQSRIDLQALWDFGARAALAGTRAFAAPAIW